MTELKPRLSRDGKVTRTENGWLLWIPAGPQSQYRLAQLDDHLGLTRGQYPLKPPLSFTLDARVSSEETPGTWGFGLWNDPYGFSFGPGNGFLRLPALPNAAWYFYSSARSHLSFREDMPGNGLLAQSFASPHFDARLLHAVAAFPFSRRTTRRVLSSIIHEEAVRVSGGTTQITDWNTYGLDWSDAGTRYSLNGDTILESGVCPRPPLGLVIWIDNQHAGFHPDGKVTWGLEASAEPAWLEIRNISITSEKQ